MNLDFKMYNISVSIPLQKLAGLSSSPVNWSQMIWNDTMKVNNNQLLTILFTLNMTQTGVPKCQKLFYCPNQRWTKNINARIIQIKDMTLQESNPMYNQLCWWSHKVFYMKRQFNSLCKIQSQLVMCNNYKHGLNDKELERGCL